MDNSEVLQNTIKEKEDNYKIDTFKEELECIENDTVKTVVKKALPMVYSDFFTAPASSSGKYHPKYSLLTGGLVRHTKACVYFAIEIGTLEQTPIDNYELDLCIASLILHDTCKSGIQWEHQGTISEHPLLPVNLLTEEDLNGDEVIVWHQINQLIKTHMGEWCTNKSGEVVTPKPKTEAQKLVHLCDYLASRRDIDIVPLVREYKEVKKSLEVQK